MTERTMIERSPRTSFEPPAVFNPSAKRALRQSTKTCASGKVGYRTRRKALRVLEALRARGDGERSYYECPMCGGFHLTSQRRRAA